MRVFGLFGLLLMPLLAWLTVKWMQHRQRGDSLAQQAVTEPVLPPGATAATALPWSEAQATLQYTLCICGESYPQVQWPRVTMLYDGKRVCAIQMRCEHCHQTRDLHFELPTASTAAPLPTEPQEERA
jgi:hypothetical protein